MLSCFLVVMLFEWQVMIVSPMQHAEEVVLAPHLSSRPEVEGEPEEVVLRVLQLPKYLQQALLKMRDLEKEVLLSLT